MTILIMVTELLSVKRHIQTVWKKQSKGHNLETNKKERSNHSCARHVILIYHMTSRQRHAIKSINH